MPDAPFRLIADDLRRKIIVGRWNPGDCLPSRRELAESYSVTPNTINRAIAELADAGLVASSDRQGTYVTDRPAQPTSAAAPTRRGRFRVALIAATDSAQTDGSRDSWTITVLRHLEATLGAAGGSGVFYRVYFAGNGEENDRFSTPEAAIKAALSSLVDAVAVININNYPWDDAIPSTLDPARVPCICINGVAMPAPFPQVTYDQFHAGYVAVRHLLDAGYARLAFLHPCTAGWIEARIAGARLALRHAGRGDDALMVVEDGAPEDYELFRGRALAARNARMHALVERALVDGSSGLGLIAHADQDALGVLDHLRAKGLQPGTSVGVIGFDDIHAGRAAGLSTVRPPLEAMGERAAAHLIAVMNGGCDVRQYCLAPTVVPRVSTHPG